MDPKVPTYTGFMLDLKDGTNVILHTRGEFG